MEDLQKVPTETLEAARDFYLESPDGQYDELAAWAIQAILDLR